MSEDLERLLGDALRGDGAPREGDLEMLERLVDRAVQPPPSATWKIGLGAGGALAGVVALILFMNRPTAPAQVSIPAPLPSIAPIASTIEAPAIAVDSLPVSAPSASHALELSAGALFTRANDARRNNRDASAIADYRTLQSRYPSSAEARASHVALGRLLLDKRADNAGALEQFDRYLSVARDGALREEALIGRALALQHLGRASEEEQAWHAVLDAYPDSIYAGTAHARLELLAR